MGITRTLTPLKSIRKKCLDCSSESYTDVRDCPITDCPLYLYRHGYRPTKGTFEGKKLTPLQAIKAKCASCSLGSYKERNLCPASDCKLWPYRHGKRPKLIEMAQVAQEGVSIAT